MIERLEYLDCLIRFREKRLIKVITGIRRCGKSTLFELFQNYLIKDGVDNKQIISINFEDGEYGDIRESKELYKFVNSQLDAKRMNPRFYVQSIPIVL